MGPALRLIPSLILRLTLDLLSPSRLVLYMYMFAQLEPASSHLGAILVGDSSPHRRQVRQYAIKLF